MEWVKLPREKEVGKSTPVSVLIPERGKGLLSLYLQHPGAKKLFVGGKDRAQKFY